MAAMIYNVFDVTLFVGLVRYPPRAMSMTIITSTAIPLMDFGRVLSQDDLKNGMDIRQCPRHREAHPV
jgi:hypothetical protein